jgi:diacylglycerol O-acyltransferase / wax synthase
MGFRGWLTNRVDMRRLNDVDALMLYTETPEIHMHTLKIGVLDVSGVEGGYSFDRFRHVAYPRLRAWPRFVISSWMSR